MLPLAYIVSDKKIKNNLEFVKVISVKDFNIDNIELPTIIVGFENAKVILKDKLSVLNRKISDNLYWTFWKTERRNYYEEDLIKFYHFVLDKLKNDIPYQSINLFKLSLTEIKRLISTLLNNKNYIFISYHTIYIYNGNIIYGISFDELEYCLINRKKVISLLYRNNNNVITNTDTFIPQGVKYLFKEYKYLYAYLLSIN